jgi:1-acyl-sn-glycerol-3-phosphate acyltransferase
MVRLMRPPLGLQVRVTGRHHLMTQRPCIYIANHQSAYDAPVLAELYSPDTVIIGKKELRYIPFFGWLYIRTGNILIDRSNTSRAVGRLREAEAAIRDRGVSVWIFPEGTRGKVSGTLLPFKKGAFYMAIATGVPLVPIVVGPVTQVFDLGRRIARPGTVAVRVLDPIPTLGLNEDDVEALIATTRTRMQSALDDLVAEQARTPAAA